MGLSGTFVARNLIASTGLIKTGIMATAFQAVVLCSAAAIYNFHLAPATVVQASVIPCGDPGKPHPPPLSFPGGLPLPQIDTEDVVPSITKMCAM